MIVNRQTIMWNLFQGMKVLENAKYGFKIEKNSQILKFMNQNFMCVFVIKIHTPKNTSSLNPCIEKNSILKSLFRFFHRQFCYFLLFE